MKQTISIPSEYNIKDLIAEVNKPFTNASEPFYFYYKDECQNLQPLNITSYNFEFEVFNNGCKQDITATLIVSAPNVLILDITNVNLRARQYDYKINFVGGNSTIKGKFIVNE